MKKQLHYTLLIISLFLVSFTHVQAQCTSTCTITASVNPTVVCAGEAVNLAAQTSCNQLLMNNNFNNGTVGTGWQSTNQAQFTNPCGAGLDGTTHLWMGSTSPAPRNITTIPFDVSNGGTICFEMKYAVQGAASPCEGPDLPDEGVHLQYSVNNGAWVDIDYWHPNGGNDPFLTQWQNYCRQIPQAAWSAATRFRWAQVSSSGNDYDHWGLDNVVISVPPPNATVQWSTGASGYYPPTVNPTATTTYTATLTDNNGCTATTSVTVTITDTIFETKPTINHCTGSSLTLTASTGTGFLWNNGANTQAITVSPTSNTQFKVTITGNSCVKVTTYPINIKQAPTANFTYSPNPICTGQPVQFTNTSTLVQTCTGFGCPNGPFCFCTDNPTLYSWTFITNNLPESTSQNPSYTYTVTGTQQVTLTLFDVLTQCTNTITIPVNITNCGSGCTTPTPLLTSVSPVCLGNPSAISITNLSTFDTGTTFVWDFGGGIATPGTGGGPHNVTWNTAGTYTVTVTATAPGCTAAQASITVIVNNGPTSTFTVTTPVCPLFPSAINYTGTAGPNATYNWDFSGGTIVSGTGAGPYLVSWANSGSMTITLTVTDNGCTSTSSQPVVVLDSSHPLCDTCHTPTPVITTTSPACLGNSVTVTAAGTTTATFLWNFDGGTAVPGTGPGPHTVTWATAGTKTITVVATEPNCLPDSATETVTIHPLPQADAGQNQDMCAGADATLTATGGNNYEWSTGANTTTITVAPAATETYTVTVIDQNNCTNTASVTVNVHNPPPANAGPDQNVCIGNSATLNASGGTTYTWSTGAQTASTTITPTVAITYTLTVSDAYGCSATDEVAINVSPLPEVAFEADITEGCPPLIVTFTSLNNTNISGYAWNFNDPSSGSGNTSALAQPVHAFTSPGTYNISLTVTSADGCSNNLTISNMITVHQVPVANFTYVISDGGYDNAPVQFTDNSLNAASWLWKFGDSNSGENTSVLPSPQHTYLTAGTFTVCLSVLSANGCGDTTCKDVNIRHNMMFYAPSAFTPNEDGLNDVFHFKGVGFDTEEFEFYVFSRWGEMLFYTNDINEGWDGTVKESGLLVPEGVYTWMALVLDFNGVRQRYFGTVTLFR